MIKDVMNKKVVTVKENTALNKAISLMDKHGYKELPVVDSKKRLLGTISYFDILRMIRFRGDSKVKNFMASSASLKKDDNINKGLKKIINSGLLGIPVINDEKKVVGFLSDYDILNFYKNYKELEPLNVGDFHLKSPRSVRTKDKVGKVRNIMLFHNRDRLPVINKEGSFTGTIFLIDILRRLYKSKPEKIGREQIKSDFTKIMDVSIESFVRSGTSIRINEKISEGIKKMLDNNILGIIVVNEYDEPVGVLNRKTVLKKIAQILEWSNILLTISGKELTSRETRNIKNYIEKNIKIPKSMIKGMHEIKIYIKRIHDSRSRGKVEVNFTIIKDHGNINVREVVGHDLLLTLDECIENAEQIMRKEAPQHITKK